MCYYSMLLFLEALSLITSTWSLVMEGRGRQISDASLAYIVRPYLKTKRREKKPTVKMRGFLDRAEERQARKARSFLRPLDNWLCVW